VELGSYLHISDVVVWRLNGRLKERRLLLPMCSYVELFVGTAALPCPWTIGNKRIANN